MSPSIRGRDVDWRSKALLGGLGYVCLLLAAGLLAGFSFTLGPSLLGIGLPILVPSALGVALCGGFAAALTSFGFRSPPALASVAASVAAVVEASSLRPSLPSLFGRWPTLAVLVVGVAAIEYGFRRNSCRTVGGSIRRSRSTERALLGGSLAALCLLLAFSLRGVGPLATLSAAGSIASLSALTSVFDAFGPPTLFVSLSVTVVLRYGLLTPLVSLPIVGALLANPLGFAFSLFTAASPLAFVTVCVLAAGEYAFRARLPAVRPRSLVG